jgi:hypothetical protein
LSWELTAAIGVNPASSPRRFEEETCESVCESGAPGVDAVDKEDVSVRGRGLSSGLGASWMGTVTHSFFIRKQFRHGPLGSASLGWHRIFRLRQCPGRVNSRTIRDIESGSVELLTAGDRGALVAELGVLLTLGLASGAV